MLEKIPMHYAFTNLPSVFDEEALTALELVSRFGSKLNEAIEAYNELHKTTLAKLAAQDKDIAAGLATLTKELPGYMSDWLEDHPEITTTIQDGEIQPEKFHESTNWEYRNGYVIPEMFGTVGEGDDTAAIQAAVNNPDCLPVLLAGDYVVSDTIVMTGGKTVVINGTLTSNVPATVYTFTLTGHHNRVTGNGTLSGNNTNCGILIQPHELTYSYYNVVDIKDIRNFDIGVLLYNPEIGGIASYFNIIEKATFTDCKIGVKLDSYANGNKFRDLTFYNCGVANSNDYGAIVLLAYDGKYPMENMFTNISTTNATNCTSILIKGESRYNQYYGLQFENGGDNGRGIYATDETVFKNNAIVGLCDINNRGSSRGTDNTIILAYGGRNEMTAIKTREQYAPASFKYTVKLKSGESLGDGVDPWAVRIDLPVYASAIIKARAIFVSSAAGSGIHLATTGDIVVRKLADGSFNYWANDDFILDTGGWIHVKTPDAGVGTTHYQNCYVEFDVMTSYRDKSVNMTPAHYGVTFEPGYNFEEYQGDW